VGVSSVVVRKSVFELSIVTEDGRVSFPVAIGSNPDGADKRSVGDCRTPEGSFEVESIEDSSEWERDGRPAYGPRFIRLRCPPWEGIGIHGTDEPETIGTRASLGCVRMRNEDVLEVASRLEVGSVVDIVP